MNRAEMIALASPPCHECGAVVVRIEQRWSLNDDGNWQIDSSYMVCAAGHRVLVEAP